MPFPLPPPEPPEPPEPAIPPHSPPPLPRPPPIPLSPPFPPPLQRPSSITYCGIGTPCALANLQPPVEPWTPWHTVMTDAHRQRVGWASRAPPRPPVGVYRPLSTYPPPPPYALRFPAAPPSPRPSPQASRTLELLPSKMIQATLRTHMNHSGVVLSKQKGKRKAQGAFAAAVRRKHKMHGWPPPPPTTPDSVFAALPELWQPAQSEVADVMNRLVLRNITADSLPLLEHAVESTATLGPTHERMRASGPGGLTREVETPRLDDVHLRYIPADAESGGDEAAPNGFVPFLERHQRG